MINTNTSGSYNFDTTIPYDLRQIYAVQIVGEHLLDVARARKADNYPAYLKSLKDLWIVSQHKIKAKDKDAIKEYEELIDNAIKIINEHSSSFAGKRKTAIGMAAIENALNKIEMFLYDKIEDAKMFGAKREIEHLV